MPLSGSHPSEFDDAFAIARRVQTSNGGFRTFRRHFPDLEADDAREIWDRVWPRARRVRYFEDTHGNTNLNLSEIGCSEYDTHLTVGYELTYKDEDGNQHQLNAWVVSDIEKKLGTTRKEALDRLYNVLSGFNYFRDQDIPFIKKQISNIRVTQVKCMTTKGAK
jgi:hypothetical protein